MFPNHLNFYFNYKISGDTSGVSVHLAGLSSLTHQGLSHYLQLNKEQVWICVKNKSSLPKWFREFPYQNWFYCGNHKLEVNPEKDLKRITVKEKY